MKNILYLFCFTTVIISIGCRNQCESVKIGEAILLENTLTYVPYNDNDTIVFISLANNSLIFVTQLIEELSWFCLEEVDCFSISSTTAPPRCEFFDFERKRNVLAEISGSGINNIEITVGIDNYQNSDDLFFDYFILGSRKYVQNPMRFNAYILEPQFSEPAFDHSKVVLVSLSEIQDSIEIHGEIFSNVFIAENAIYQYPNGIVAYEYQGQYYFPE